MEKNRVGLKEIAELSGMSIGNVSMVLRGLGDEARISKASQEKIQNAARQLNYKPNVYAKRLRMKADHMIVAVFFASSRHVSVMGSFFSGIHELLCGNGDMKPEITLYPYTQGQLDRMDSVIREECFNGAIFMGMSSEDMDYLETVRIDTPIVVFNRVSKIHHYVYADNQNVGELAARLFSRAGDSGVCLVSGRKSVPRCRIRRIHRHCIKASRSSQLCQDVRLYDGFRLFFGHRILGVFRPARRFRLPAGTPAFDRLRPNIANIGVQKMQPSLQFIQLSVLHGKTPDLFLNLDTPHIAYRRFVGENQRDDPVSRSQITKS